jgi:hypothetical protein
MATQYTPIDDDTHDPCSQCDAEPTRLYEDDAGEEVALCESCADDYPRCPCGERGEIEIANGGGLVVCRVCAAEEEGEEA